MIFFLLDREFEALFPTLKLIFPLSRFTIDEVNTK
jgi:hypothetical protein